MLNAHLLSSFIALALVAPAPCLGADPAVVLLDDRPMLFAAAEDHRALADAHRAQADAYRVQADAWKRWADDYSRELRASMGPMFSVNTCALYGASSAARRRARSTATARAARARRPWRPRASRAGSTSAIRSRT